MEDTVLPLFFNSYLYLPKDPHIRNGFMEILPGMFSNARVGSHLHTSTLAVAFFTVAAWAGQGSLLRASEAYFTGALPKIREALMKDDDTDFETVLISILLLSTYEEFVAIKDWRNPMKAHLRGAIALINSKMPKTLEGPSSSTICNAVQTQIIKTTRGLANPLVPTPKVWPLLQPTTPPSPRIFLSSTASQLVQLRHDWENTRFHGNNETEVKAILKRAMDIDVGLVSWTYWVPAHWVPEAATIIPQSVRNAGIYRNRCDCYVDMWIASTWNSYRDCRMLVQSIIVSCLRMIPLDDPDGGRLAAATAVIQKLADDVCATVPYFLGSQMESVRLKPGLVDYPYAETRPVTLTHKQSAPLMGAWHIIAYLRNLQGPELGLPPEQVDWVERQMDRVLTIYFQR
ncbi:uncharacterized protein N7459_000586 [Penicillium hispanicum]|uniref:uncharacterized protein n=1 Tax=Penicillium hispanicum TaxID=1080232 RepID=UPI0025400A43|nr:uncharacterized protein N7459_000586 [Penicillium hispanicum]KAJ5594378.1 hypothetical protein N7459_000586 [Penicillium hispanicum]